MNIILFVNKDFEANLAYQALKKELTNHNVCIYYSESVGNPSGKPSDLVKLERYEKKFFFDGVTQFISEQSVDSSFEFFGDHFTSFPIKKCIRLKSADFISELKAFEPDLFISIRFGKIFKDEIIQIPKHGLINLHSAILPDYRGILGTLHALKHGTSKIGCTLHTIPNSGIDTEELIDIATLEVNPGKSLFWHVVQLYPLGVQLIIKALRTLEAGQNWSLEKQDLNQGSYFSVPTSQDFKELNAQGFEAISDQDYIAVLQEFVFTALSKTQQEKLVSLITEELH